MPDMQCLVLCDSATVRQDATSVKTGCLLPKHGDDAGPTLTQAGLPVSHSCCRGCVGLHPARFPREAWLASRVNSRCCGEM